MIIIEKNAGQKIGYELDGTVLSFADGELAINLARYQQDERITKDIMVDSEGYLTMGHGRYYVAQVEIPEKEYECIESEMETDDNEGHASVMYEPLPLDVDKVTLYLFSIEGILIK